MTANLAASTMHTANNRGFSAIVARTSTGHMPAGPKAYGFADIPLVRPCSVVLCGEFGHRHLNVAARLKSDGHSKNICTATISPKGTL